VNLITNVFLRLVLFLTNLAIFFLRLNRKKNKQTPGEIIFSSGWRDRAERAKQSRT
jgi:hypothetical protein